MKEKGFKFKVQSKIILRTIKNNQREVVFPTIKAVQRIGIVGDNGCLDGIDLNSNQLVKKSKLYFLIYKKGRRTKGDEDENIYTSDLNFWGLPFKRKIEGFIVEPFDLLINLSDKKNEALAYVCAASVSKFKVGINTNDKIYDLIIEQKGKKQLDIFAEIEKILNNFNKNY